MKIDFYEEFPTRENLSKLKLINFKTRLFIAAKSLEEFKRLEKQAKRFNKRIECAYWPIIKHSYWVSPFANPSDLRELFKELNSCKNKILIDIELPMLNKKLIVKNLFSLAKNKRLIRAFLEKNKNRITTAQFPSVAFSWLTGLLGLDYNVKLEKSIMWYSSMCNKIVNRIIKNNLAKIKDKKSYSASLGTIAKGVLGNEPILPPEKLEEDLNFVKKAGFRRVIIFRLGGLDEEYLSLLEKYIK